MQNPYYCKTTDNQTVTNSTSKRRENVRFYKDLDEAEQEIASGNGKVINNMDELNALFV